MMDNFASRIPQESMTLLLDLGNEFHFDPLSSIESETYFLSLLENYRGPEDLTAYLRTQIHRDFRFFNAPPDWLQGPDWPFHRGKPMYFVGQLDSTVRRDGFAYGLMFYVFWDPEDGATKTITQSD